MKAISNSSGSGADRWKQLGHQRRTGTAVGNQSYRLQRHDLGLPGRELIQVRVDIAPGVLAPNHSHPGEEAVYVIEGLLEYQLEGEPPVTLKAGEVLFIPARKLHSAKNVGNVNAAELATYIVENGKPLAAPDQMVVPAN